MSLKGPHDSETLSAVDLFTARSLKLQNCQFTSILPNITAMPLLQQLDVSGNSFNYSVASALLSGSSSSLRSLSLSRTPGLFGSAVTSAVTNLVTVRSGVRRRSSEFSSNSVTRCCASVRLFNIDAGRTLLLDGNGMNGTVPTIIATLPLLEYFSAANNQLIGTLPSAFVTGLRYLCSSLAMRLPT